MQDHLMAVFHRLSINFCRTLVHTVGHGTALQTMHFAVECAALKEVYFSAFYRMQRRDLAICIALSAPDLTIFNSYRY